jgi:hypothetical protein
MPVKQYAWLHQRVCVPGTRVPARWVTRGEEGWGSGP